MRPTDRWCERCWFDPAEDAERIKWLRDYYEPSSLHSDPAAAVPLIVTANLLGRHAAEAVTETGWVLGERLQPVMHR
jgi:hypothetical protein